MAVYLPEAATANVRANARVEYVSKGRPVYAFAQEDASWGYDYHDADYANDEGFKGQGFVIGVIDSGVDCGRPDIDCVAGKSFITGEGYEQDYFNHGTGVAGVAAGIVDNGGYVGVAGKAKIMPVKIGDWLGRIPDSCVTSAMAIDWAVDNGADVLNLSYGFAWDDTMYTRGDCEIERGAIIAALSNAVFIAAAAGNVVQNGDSVNWPARWNYGHVAAVSGLTRDWWMGSHPVRFWGGSSFGSQVDIAGAADDVLLLNAFGYGGQYRTGSGTSFSAPAVAGAAVLLMERWAVLRNVPDRVLRHMRYTAKMPDPPFQYDETRYGGGILDLYAAINNDPCWYEECGVIPDP